MNWSEYNDTLERHIRPATFPVAMKMLPPGEEPPPKARRPWRDLGVRMATCQVWNTTRRYGWTLAAGPEDLSCPPGKIVAGFEPAIPYYLEGHICAGMYTETTEAGTRTEAATPRLEYQRYATFLSAPLAKATFEPDVIVIYGNPAQIMRLAIAALYQSGGRLESSFSGRLDCSDILVDTPQKDTPQVILPCYGDRIFGQTQDHEMAFALTPARLPALLEGLEGTHRGGVRYPIPNYMRYTGRYPQTYEHMEEIWHPDE